MKKVVIVVLVLIAVAVVGLSIFASKMDGIIADAIRTEGSSAMGTQVDVAAVTTDIQQGLAQISMLTVANPAGYSDSHAIVVEEFAAKVDYKNLAVELIEIEAPKIFAELKGKRTNFQDLLEAIPESSSDESRAQEDDTEIVIRRLAINRPQVQLRADDLKQPLRQFELSSFVATDLMGTSDDIADQLSRQFMAHISRGVKDEVSQQLKQAATDKATELVKEKLNEKLGGRLKDLKLNLGGKQD